MSAPTIAVIAERAGVAVSTVSRALSNPTRVNIQTRHRIEEIAREVGYLPRGRVRTRSVAVVVADIGNPFYFGIIRGTHHQLRAADYSLTLLDTEESGDLEADLIERLRPNIDGVVLAASRLSDAAIAALARTVPVVVINRNVPTVPSVVIDTPSGMEQALEHLVSLGHHEIVYVSGPGRVGPFAPRRTSGTAAADALVNSRATAAIAYNDLVAIGMLGRLAERGISVPGALSIIGCDDIFGADFCSPSLTTVTAPIEQAARVAVTLLLGSLESRPGGKRDGVLLPTHLTVRGSTGPLA